jgi:polyketide synthase PksJ
VEERWLEHARGKIGAASHDGPRKNKANIDRLIARGRKVSKNGEARQFITTGPRWHSLREAYVADNEALAVLEIDERFSDDFTSYELHPSLLDIATGFIQFLGDGDYLPLVYERLTIHAPIPRKAVSHVVFRGEARERREIITCDVSILDEDGVEAVTIDGFSMKHVAAGALQQSDANGQAKNPERAAIRSLSDGIPPGKGAEAFRRILSAGNVPQLIVSTRDIHELIQRADSLTRTRLLEDFESAGAKKMDHARPASSGVYTEPKGEIERRIASVWQRVLGIEQVGVHDNFFELGGTSLNGIELVSELKKEFKVDIPVVSIFEATTVAELAKYLSREERDETFERIQDRAERKKKALAAPRRPPGKEKDLVSTTSQ